MHAKPDLRVFLKWMITRSGSVIVTVIPLEIRQGNSDLQWSFRDEYDHLLAWNSNILTSTVFSLSANKCFASKIRSRHLTTRTSLNLWTKHIYCSRTIHDGSRCMIQYSMNWAESKRRTQGNE